jgi:hypothetical protein
LIHPGFIQESEISLDAARLGLVHPLMLGEIFDESNVPTLVVFPKGNPPYAGKLLEGSWNLLGIFLERENLPSNQDRVGHEVTLIIGPIQQGDGKEPAKFGALAKSLVHPKLWFYGSDSHRSGFSPPFLATNSLALSSR